MTDAADTKIKKVADAVKGLADVAFERELAAVRAADAQRELEKLLPPDAELWPGMREQLAVYFQAQLSFMLIDDYLPAEHWWEKQMSVRERRYLCRLARLDPETGALNWTAVKLPDRARLIARFMWLHTWVNSCHPPLQPYHETPFDEPTS